MKPSIGRVVHYVAYGTPGGEFKAGAHRAATITEVNEKDEARLFIMNPTGAFFSDFLKQDPTGEEPGTWHQPEYVPEEKK